MSSSKPIYIDTDEVNDCLHNQWDKLIHAVENALKGYSLGQVIQPVRSAIKIARHNGLLLTMPGYSLTDDSLATKLVTIYNDNKAVDLPSIQATILLYNAANGSLRAILDGVIITNMRTAAASAVATKYLANKSPKILAILGAGVQARSHYKVMAHLYDFENIHIWNINEASAQALVKEIQEDGYPCKHFNKVSDAVKDADIIVTVTASSTPLIEKDWVKPGTHINAVGAHSPTAQELSVELMRSAVVYADSKAGAVVESGDVILSGADVYAEIGEVIAGTKEAFPERVTVFKSLGMAIEDVVAAELVFDLYEKKH